MGRIFITGDTHRQMIPFIRFNTSYGDDLSKEDYLIVTGDFGFVFSLNQHEEYCLDMLDSFPWTTLFINGNHDNVVALNQMPTEEWNGGLVHKVRDSVIHLMTGEVYDIEGKTFFCFGGARSVDAAYRTPYKDWWPEEIPTIKEYDRAQSNLEDRDFKVDYIITHAMPDVFTKELYGSKYRGGDKTAYMLDDFLLQCMFKKWYCGHYHLDVAMRPNIQICYKEFYEVI